jgi:hypothetical protein
MSNVPFRDNLSLPHPENSAIPKERGAVTHQKRGTPRLEGKHVRDYVELRLLANLGPGFLVLLEGVDFHPTFKDRHGIDHVSTVDEFLHHVGERGFAETPRFVKTGGLVPFL